MMKKKMHDQEENSRKNNDESTDNKENPESQENLEVVKPENVPVNKTDTEPALPSGTDDTADKVGSEVRIVEEKLAEMQDRYLRLSAEFDNYRKRTLREKMDLSKYAEENLLLKIIPLMDDLERARQHMDVSIDCESMKNGIDLIYLKFNDFLKQSGIREIDALNSDFDVDKHEAISKVQVDDESKKGKVVDVVLKGYYLQDKVLRFAKVVVGE
jgi:molecular chaperone GrpE